MTEFDIIERFFTRKSSQRGTLLGTGDDCALIQIPSDQCLAITTDTLVSGVHFPKNEKPEHIGYKAIAVNLSDLAAMGAEPKWITGTLTLPAQDETWLQQFCAGFFELVDQYQLDLIGGDLTQGPLSITIQAHGLVPYEQALKRSGAKPGDFIYVSGTLGDAGAALKIIQDRLDCKTDANHYFLNKLQRPVPRVELGIALRGIASAAIDISDGLSQDLNHILRMSGVGAAIQLHSLPLSECFKQSIPSAQQIPLALSSGDAYELCFTVPPERVPALEKNLKNIDSICTPIGRIESTTGLRYYNAKGQQQTLEITGFQHFTEPPQ